MRLIDEQVLETPYCRGRRMARGVPAAVAVDERRVRLCLLAVVGFFDKGDRGWLRGFPGWGVDQLADEVGQARIDGRAIAGRSAFEQGRKSRVGGVREDEFAVAVV